MTFTLQLTSERVFERYKSRLLKLLENDIHIVESPGKRAFDISPYDKLSDLCAMNLVEWSDHYDTILKAWINDYKLTENGRELAEKLKKGQ